MAAQALTRGKRLVLVLAALVAAVLAVLGSGPQAHALALRAPASAAAEEHLECKHRHEAQSPASPTSGRHRASGAPPLRVPGRPGAEHSDDDSHARPAPQGPAPANTTGSRPAALSRIQVFRC
ncbi:hypothetical protein [Kitasatospora cineracea]|uniref:Uncharacterized protein n=1 Tax=Kitasatospora cineracea TaxID=88074 RepID=A0A8G1XAV6_9ACTN|nr:hypothetical protein [Kitasatospora cineracea]ROR43009.1 hypothetical protein EDD39_1144 [Kitasatospora cineracea]